MAQIKIEMPQMGESITEATIIKWSKTIGESVDFDETLLEIATDKVDSEIPSPAKGTLIKIFFEEDVTVPVGTVIALIGTEAELAQAAVSDDKADTNTTKEVDPIVPIIIEKNTSTNKEELKNKKAKQFHSPLVKSIAQKEQISDETLATIHGTGLNNRVTKKDLLKYVATKKIVPLGSSKTVEFTQTSPSITAPILKKAKPSFNGVVEAIEMDNTRRLVAEQRVASKQISPHVTSMVEVDVTNLVNWHKKIAASFQETNRIPLTFHTLYIEAVVKAIRDFPLINSSIENTTVLRKKDINIALSTGGTSSPVIKNTDYLNLTGLAAKVQSLLDKLVTNTLLPEDLIGGTFTVLDLGATGIETNMAIIQQPQVAILSAGVIKKKPAVLETVHGDVIAIRQKLLLSLSYDHRIVDGQLGGSFLRKVADYLEQFDIQRAIT